MDLPSTLTPFFLGIGDPRRGAFLVAIVLVLVLVVFFFDVSHSIKI